MREVLAREEKRKKEEAEEVRKQRDLEEQLTLTQKLVSESQLRQAEQVSVLQSERYIA